ncbi:MAG: tetratricopeptide repeat protein [Bacteroidales bacterium]|jgi:tetratricopeptide (TPR) repeat protein|nr:tetratricopeptide repeat protein [Bacteroidales bacterium]
MLLKFSDLHLGLKHIICVFLFCLATIIAQAQEVNDIIQQADSLSNQPEKALALLNKAIETNPESEELLKVRAETYSHLKQYGKAADDYRQMTKLAPDEEMYWYQLGRNQYEDKQYAEAIPSLERAIKLNAQYLPAYHIKIQVLLALNKPDEALKTSNSTLQIGETAMNYFLQGEVNKRLNARQQAEWAYTKATKLDKGFMEAFIALSNLSADMNKTQDALENADAALAINPESADAMLARSRGLMLNKQYTDAIDDATDVIKKNPDNVQAHYWRGLYYREVNKNQEALKDFEWVLKAEPSNWRAVAGRADSYVGIGNKDKAVAEYKKLLADAATSADKDAITQLANERIFELNRENHAPQLVIAGVSTENFDMVVPDTLAILTLKGKITDESPIGKLLINNKEVTFKAIDDGYEFTANVNLANAKEIQLEVSDVYNNINKLSYQLVKSETGKPEITIFTPKSDEKGVIVITGDNSSTLYIEGKITDASNIVSIEIDGKAIDFDHDSLNPAFSSTIDISNKTTISIEATDQYGNTAEHIFTIEKITSELDSTNVATQQSSQNVSIL